MTESNDCSIAAHAGCAGYVCGIRPGGWNSRQRHLRIPVACSPYQVCESGCRNTLPNAGIYCDNTRAVAVSGRRVSARGACFENPQDRSADDADRRIPGLGYRGHRFFAVASSIQALAVLGISPLLSRDTGPGATLEKGAALLLPPVHPPPVQLAGDAAVQ